VVALAKKSPSKSPIVSSLVVSTVVSPGTVPGRAPSPVFAESARTVDESTTCITFRLERIQIDDNV